MMNNFLMMRYAHRSDYLLAASGLGLGGVALLTITGTVNWADVVQWIQHISPAYLLAASGLALVIIAFRRSFLRGRKGIERPDIDSGHSLREPLQPIRWWLALLALSIVIIATFLAMRWLLNEADGAQDAASARIDAVRAAVTLGAGVAGAAALLFTARRQWLGERTQAHLEEDASERHITELYTKAVEQLGHENAPVRLGGLYGLERLAQSNAAHRQTIVNVICAYLRMPFTEPSHEERTVRVRPARRLRIAGQHSVDRGQSAIERSSRENEQRQELQVRLTAQGILLSHLHSGTSNEDTSGHFWNEISLNLSRATLHNFDMSDCIVAKVTFAGARFVGRFSAKRTRFKREAGFRLASFTSGAHFGGAHFEANVKFGSAVFDGPTKFENVIFARDALFERARFDKDLLASGAKFEGNAKFNFAQFSGPTHFRDVEFGVDVSFFECHAAHEMRFTRAHFIGRASFARALLDGQIGFSDAVFGSDSTFAGMLVRGDANFNEAKFSALANFEHLTAARAVFSSCTFKSLANFGHCTFSGDVLLSGAIFEREALFDDTKFGSEANFRRAHFQAGVDFGRSRFEGIIVIADAEPKEAFDFGEEVVKSTRRPRGYRVQSADNSSDVNSSGLSGNSES